MPSKKIAMIVAFRDFRDEEYFVPKEILESGGIEVKTVSNQEGEAIGAEGGEAKVDILLENLNLSDFDGIIFVGGPECLKYLDNENSYRVIREAVKEDKLLAAICISPVVLSNSKEGKSTIQAKAISSGSLLFFRRSGLSFPYFSIASA